MTPRTVAEIVSAIIERCIDEAARRHVEGADATHPQPLMKRMA
ncbi:hypothetical protein [Aureimonas glaciei]|nr:hypothetical protein [Aureimonas glaciei]